MAETPQQLDPQVRDRVKTILRRDLKLGADTPIDDDMPLIGGDFELDSLDIVLMVTSVEKEFGIKIANETIGKDAFTSVGSLVQFLQERIENQPAADHASTNGNGNGHAPAPAAPTAPTARSNGSNGHNSNAPADTDHLLADLPHQPPFRFITRVGELAPQVHGEGQWELTGDEDFFRGHFPGRPIVPGVLLSEALAQLSGLVGVDPRAAGSQRAELAQVEVRFRQAVAPPATIALRSRMLQDMNGLQRFEVQALLDEQVIADGQITLKRTDAR